MLGAPVELGLGAREALSEGGRGRVVGVFRRAAYLQVPGGLFALTTPDVPNGAIHARSDVAPDSLHAGDPVVVTADHLQAGPFLLDLATARTWRGALPTAAGLEGHADLTARVFESAPVSGLAEATIRSAIDALRARDLGAAAALLGGFGPGLTPAGDDCLAGILLVARIRWGADPGAAHRLARTADHVATNDIALAFLRWAARGQSIEPVHRLLNSVAAGDEARGRGALDALVAFGHSSGADLALGLRLSLRELPPLEPCNARAIG